MTTESKNTRYRKKPNQMDTLWQVYKQHKGKMPPHKLRIELAKELGMRENQVYKWFWEVKHKQQDATEPETVTKSLQELSEE